MHSAWHIIEFTLEVGNSTHSIELTMLTRGHHLINIKAGNRPVAHQRILIIVISQMLLKINHCYLGWGLQDLVLELVVVRQAPLTISKALRRARPEELPRRTYTEIGIMNLTPKFR